MNTTSILYNCASKAVSPLEVCLQSATKYDNFKLGTSHRVFHAKQSLFSAGDLFEGVYILRSGSAKSFITSVDGEEHITKFLYPGDLLGIDGFDKYVHTQNVLFLETSSVCLVCESELDDLLKNSDDFRRYLLSSMSHSLVSDSSMMMCLSTCSSEQKLARFIHELSEQFISLGLSGSEFRLSMTRTDIASYLGMALETVSRVFASFQLKKIIGVTNRQLSILDFVALNHFVTREIAPLKITTSLHQNKCIGAVY